MTKDEANASPKDAALRLALEALSTSMYPQPRQLNAIAAIKAALEAKDEPVAWISPTELLVMRGNALGGAKDWRVNVGLKPEDGDVGLYTTPPQRTWVGLTRDEILEARWHNKSSYKFARVLEAKLKDKNI
jgi:hypothetical protein